MLKLNVTVGLVQSYMVLYEQAIRRSDFSHVAITRLNFSDSLSFVMAELQQYTCQEARSEHYRG
jgi:hypothetical protein